jgi:hypothetical protein
MQQINQISFRYLDSFVIDVATTIANQKIEFKNVILESRDYGAFFTYRQTNIMDLMEVLGNKTSGRYYLFLQQILLCTKLVR